jgi:hypothetical protein
MLFLVSCNPKYITGPLRAYPHSPEFVPKYMSLFRIFFAPLRDYQANLGMK